jgi:Transcription factor WhiB
VTPAELEQARCAQPAADPRWWDGLIEGEGPSERYMRQRMAITICGTCPVIAQCRAAARRSDDGVWAGRVMNPPRPHRATKKAS